MSERPETARLLDLQPHPEGGWFRETFRSEVEVEVDLPGGTRRASTLINFLLPAGEVSAWHSVAATEIWVWQGPGMITIQLGGDGDQPDTEPRSYVLGSDFAAGQLPQLIIPPGVWQRTLPGADDALASCLVSPGFEYEDFRLFQ
ncbi:cupin [Microlunatus endophyticus]|uniref:Cupin n=1 Tax=Microlunatus endophyticus TaxID=1716077 RepID=A0A917SAL0_9ACTN|nr:cupin domain-containing protein [Microlunatus endophyticus]GGL67754.1 cupin [Microlunatus endophyticus]